MDTADIRWSVLACALGGESAAHHDHLLSRDHQSSSRGGEVDVCMHPYLSAQQRLIYKPASPG